MLHTLSCSPWQFDIREMLRMMKSGDDLLLIQDGVLVAIKDNLFISKLTDTCVSVSIFALKEDIHARGISNLVSDKVKIVDYVYFVNLTIKHINQVNW